MNPHALFSLSSAMALAGWMLLVILPHRRVTRYLVGFGIVQAIMSVMYLVALIIGADAFSEGGFGSLTDVRALFDNDWLLLAGWVHYLAFDLFVGYWITVDARKKKIPHLIIVVPLLLTFLLGPVGFLTYWLIRTFNRRSLSNILEHHAFD